MAATLVFWGLLAVLGAASGARFQVVREWRYLNFTWPLGRSAFAPGAYVPENVVVAGVKFHAGFYYLTLPRMRGGVPATLARIPAGATDDTAPPLEPFPSWAMNAVGDCAALQNVQNVEIDASGRMWIIDGGRVDTLAGAAGRSACAPKLMVFDIGANRTERVAPLPEAVAARGASFLYDLVLDDADGGFAYITDNSATDPGIVVYSMRQDRAWKVRHPRSMAGDPRAAAFAVNGVAVTAPINLAGIALGPSAASSASRTVYYSALSSLRLFAVSTAVLRRPDAGLLSDADVEDLGAKPSQSAAMVMDNHGVLYYSLLGSNAIGRWDSRTSFASGQRIVARDERYIEWPSSFAFDRNGNLTVVTNRLNRFIFARLNLDEPNFRLISAHVGGDSYLFGEHVSDDGARFDGGIRDVRDPPRPSSAARPLTNLLLIVLCKLILM